MVLRIFRLDSKEGTSHSLPVGDKVEGVENMARDRVPPGKGLGCLERRNATADPTLGIDSRSTHALAAMPWCRKTSLDGDCVPELKGD
jgi:hypothetical protein